MATVFASITMSLGEFIAVVIVPHLLNDGIKLLNHLSIESFSDVTHLYFQIEN